MWEKRKHSLLIFCVGAIFLILNPEQCLSYKIFCDEGWVGFSESPSCYRFITEKLETYQSAKDVCENYDGFPLVIDSVPEKEYISTLMTTTNYRAWLGLTFDTESSKWQWYDNTTVNPEIITWNNDTKSGCATLRKDGRLDGEPCTNTYPYFCERPLGSPKKCGDGWEKFGKSCYQRFHHESRPWDEARSMCLERDADLLVVNDLVENSWVYAFSNRDQVDVWLGLRENKSINAYVWINGQKDGGENVLGQQWMQDEPADRNGNGAALMSQNSEAKWSTAKFDQNAGFVCEKPQGSFCMFDLIPHSGSCYDFYLDPFASPVNWDVADDKCENSGMDMIIVNNENEQTWLNKYLFNTGIFNSEEIKGMWIGYYEPEKNSKTINRATDDQPLSEDDYNELTTEPNWNPEVVDCVYTIVCDPNTKKGAICNADDGKRWDVNGCPNSDINLMQGCEMKKGDSLDISNLMHPKMYCPEGWGSPFAEYCYLPISEEKSWGEAQSFCKDNQSTSDLASVFSVYEDIKIRTLAKDLGDTVTSWIGLRDTLSEGNWVWADGISATYTHWKTDEPNGGRRENCVGVAQEGWVDDNCGDKKPFICKMKATPNSDGNPSLPDTSTMPPTNNCGYMGNQWVEEGTTGMCYALVSDKLLTWHDAREYCKEIGGYRSGGDLASIGSQQEQQFFNSWFSIVQHFQSTWFGLYDVEREGGFEWSDGSPFAYLNWRDGEPNGNTYENCGEFLVDTLDDGWNDYDCTQPLPFICEKKGDNYVPPPAPEPPKPACPKGWHNMLGKCVYYSYDFSEKADNWTQARQKCNGAYAGAKLAAIKDQAAQDAFYSIMYDYTYATYFGGNDADNEGTWIWEDNTEFTYTNWGANEPNGGESENCLEVDVYGTWNDVDCGGLHNINYMCETAINICPDDGVLPWYYYDGQCWLFPPHDEKVPFQAAKDKCQEGNPLSHLVSIHSERDNSIVQSVVEYDNMWTGLMIDGKDNYHWDDGTPVDYQAWKEGEPNNIESEKCTSLSHKDGTWSSDNCDDSKYFTCRFKSTHYYSCPSGWEKWNYNCYLLQPEIIGMNWEEAEWMCSNHDSHLVSIVNNKERNFIKSFIASYHKCGDYWTEDPDNKMCYFYSDESVTWSQAKSACEEEDSTLVIIQTAAKNQKLLSFTSVGSSFWAGGNDIAQENTWTWINNSTFNCEENYCDWHQGEPNGDVSENCLEVHHGEWNDGESQGSWNDAACEGQLFKYICEKPMMDNVKKSTWIGLNDFQDTQTLTWSDKSRVTYTKWGIDQPYHHPGDKYKCAILNEDKEMELVDCLDESMSICKRPVEISIVPPNTYGCQHGQFEYQGSCYEIMHDYKTFSNAESSCKSNGGDLISINDGDEQAKLVSILASSYGEFFIGLKYNDATYMFEWASGDVVTYTDAWDHYQPDLDWNDEWTGKCAVVSTESDGLWWLDNCGEIHNYICEYPRNGYTNPPTKPTTPPPPEAQCEGPEWIKVNNHCYRYFNDTPMSFPNAEDFCRTKAGHLVSFSSGDEETNSLTNVFNAMDYYSEYFFWVGLRQSDEQDDGGYYWSDDTPYDYSFFASGQPDTHGGSDNCVIDHWMSSYSYGWENKNCEMLLPFVCEVLAGDEAPTTLEPPTQPPLIPCQGGIGDDWFQGPEGVDFCYKFHQSTNEQDTWLNVEYKCLQEGGHLASIHSRQENDFLMVMFSRNGIDNAFIGLYVNGEEQFAWTDGSTTEYFNWDNGEPNNFWGMETCGELVASHSGHWNDAHCSKPASGYACKRPTNGEWTTAKPTDLPVGHCPPNHYEFKGYCFKFFGLNANVSEYKNWTMARDICRDLGGDSFSGNYYDLASVHSDKEQAFLSTIFAENDPGSENFWEFWIGYRDFVHWDPNNANTFVWSDGTANDYTNWANNEPNDNFQYENICVEMYAHDDYDIGHWNDLTCDRELAFVCKTRASSKYPDVPNPRAKCKDLYSDYDKFKSDCYKLNKDQPKTWDEAESACGTIEKGHLVSILTESEQAFVLNEMKSEMTWIGLSDKQSPGYFKWSDGWPMQMSKWGMEPDPSNSEGICAAFNTTDGKWWPKSCTEKYPFLCKHSDAQPPTPSPNGECPTSDFIDLDPNLDSCYFFKMDGANIWNDAHMNCISMGHGSNFASIHSKNEIDKISAELQKYGKAAWIGLFATAQNNRNFLWADTSALDFQNWADSEPNNGGYELCVEMFHETGQWNDASCDPYGIEKGYICKAPKIIPPTSPPRNKTTTMTSSTPTNPPDTTKTTQTSPTDGSTTTIHNTPPPDTETNGMSGGVIAIVVIICLVAVAGGGVFLVVYFKRDSQIRKLLRLNSPPNTGTQSQPQSFDNLGYEAASSPSSLNETG